MMHAPEVNPAPKALKASKSPFFSLSLRFSSSSSKGMLADEVLPYLSTFMGILSLSTPKRWRM